IRQNLIESLTGKESLQGLNDRGSMLTRAFARGDSDADQIRFDHPGTFWVGPPDSDEVFSGGVEEIQLADVYLLYDTFSPSKGYTGAAIYQVLKSQYFQMHVAVSRFPVFSICR